MMYLVLELVESSFVLLQWEGFNGKAFDTERTLLSSVSMDNRIWQTVRAVLMDKRLISVGFLLLAVVTIHSLLPCDLRLIVSELDILEHFLFGFVLSDFASVAASPMGLKGWLNERLRWKDSRRVDMMIRILGFLLIGGVLWELSELFIFPMFGSRPNQFFSLPITLTNINGTIDVMVGIVGCIFAWNLSTVGLRDQNTTDLRVK